MSYQSFDNIGLAQRPSLSYTTITALGKPTQVTFGAWKGYSLPIFNSDDEELYFTIKTPRRWNGTTNFIFSIHVWLTGTEDIDDAFKMQLSWSNSNCDNVLSDTPTNVEVETAIVSGRTATKSVYCVDFEIDASTFTAGDILAGRLRRIAAVGTAITSEIAVYTWDLDFKRDKIGVVWA